MVLILLIFIYSITRSQISAGNPQRPDTNYFLGVACRMYTERKGHISWRPLVVLRQNDYARHDTAVVWGDAEWEFRQGCACAERKGMWHTNWRTSWWEELLGLCTKRKANQLGTHEHSGTLRPIGTVQQRNFSESWLTTVPIELNTRSEANLLTHNWMLSYLKSNSYRWWNQNLILSLGYSEPHGAS